jgi:hypothetical protein
MVAFIVWIRCAMLRDGMFGVYVDANYFVFIEQMDNPGDV